MKQSPDKGKSVAWYIAEKLSADWQKEAMQDLDNLILKHAPDAKSTIKWSQPVYENADGPFVFMKGNKNHITFGFWRGAELTDPDGVLEGAGEKMKHVKIKSKDGINESQLSAFIQQALELNRKLGNPTR